MPTWAERPDLIVFYGRGGASEPERLVAGAQQASVRQLLTDAPRANCFRKVALATNDEAFAADLVGAPPALIVVPTGETIVFGEQLRAIARQLDSTAIVYVGGGSAPLLDVDGLRQLVAAVDEPGLVSANNLL